MNILVISLGVVTIVAGLAAWTYQMLECSRKETEKNIALFFRDRPMECTLFLNRISLEETKKEIRDLEHFSKYGF